MKSLLPALAIAAALAVPAWAATPKDAPMTKQQTRMSECNKEAGDKKGDERKGFMKECLSAKAAQQEKMKACTKEAGAKKGDERKAFVKECLSK